MKKVIYSLLGILLILPFICEKAGELVEIEDVEPKVILLSSNVTILPMSLGIEEVEPLIEEVVESEEQGDVLVVKEEAVEENKVAIMTMAKPEDTVVENVYTDKESLLFELTAFTAGVESTGKSKGHPEYGITASGKKVEEGKTIACPPSMPFGTEVYIPSLGNTYECQDRGSAIKEGRLDIYIEDLKEALKFGRKKNVEVFILQ